MSLPSAHMTQHLPPRPQPFIHLFLSLLPYCRSSLSGLICRRLASKSCTLTALANGPSSISTSAFFRSNSSLPGVLNTLCLDATVPPEILDRAEDDVWRVGSSVDGDFKGGVVCPSLRMPGTFSRIRAAEPGSRAWSLKSCSKGVG